MEDTTTPVDGVASDEAVTNAPSATQPTPPSDEGTQTTEAVTDDQSTSTEPKDAEAAPEEEAQATDEFAKFAKAKGFDPEALSDGERKALEMARNAEKRMHEATQKPVEPPAEVPLTGDDSLDGVIARQNATDLKLYVRDWFDGNPEMKEYRSELTKIANERPWLQNMDDVKAHFLSNPEHAAQLKSEGGRQALANLAQKQQAIPPSANATNSAVYESNKITSENVDDLVAKNSQAWYNEHRDEIRAASFGQVPG